VIPPGGEGKIKVTLHPKGKATQITKRVVVHTDDPEQPQFALTMSGRLLVDVIAKPTSIKIDNLDANESGSATFKLDLGEGSDAKIESVEIDDTKNFALRRTDEDGSFPATYEVVFHGRDSVGNSPARIKVLTTGKNTPELLIPVRAIVAKNLRYIRSLRFARKEGVLQEREIHISARRGDAPKIGKVEDPDGLVEFEVQEARGALVSIKVKVIEERWNALDDKAKKLNHRLIVHTDDAEEPEIVFRYRVAPPSSRKNKASGPIRATRMLPD
jgi:hypothetical protein